MLSMVACTESVTWKQSKAQFNVLIQEKNRWEARCPDMEEGIALVLKLIGMEPEVAEDTQPP